MTGRVARIPRRARRALAAVLLAAGLGLLGSFSWQLVGTDVVAHRRQGAAVEALQRRWSEGRPAAVTAHGTATALVRVPRFGSAYVVPVLEGAGPAALGSGLGHLPGTADPGAVGNYVLAGHRITHGEPFRRLPDLRRGDRVVVETRAERLTYALDGDGDALTVPFTATWVLDPRPATPGAAPAGGPARLLTLVTCAELFHTEDRLVVFGHLVDRVPR